ncbi:MAG: DUF1579 domain-containing protein [Pirellulales bacterium]
MQPPTPEREHLWLQRLVGDWTIEMEYQMGPDQPLAKSSRRESVRSLGALWIIGEGSDAVPGGPVDSITTLGFDPQTQRFVGTFITSMMTHLWPYNGVLDAAGRVLTLDSEGPNFAGDGAMARYQDMIEIVTDDERILSSQVLGTDGQWTLFMKAYYRRKR